MTALVFLPAGDRPLRWWRPGDDARGLGVPAGDARVVAVAPADAVTLHWAAIPTRSAAQATAAARLLIGDASAVAGTGAGPGLHVAVGDEGGEQRPIGVVAADAMRAWLATLADAGVDPDAVVPAALLLPVPAQGFVAADIAGERVVRGPGAAFADEDGLTALVTGGVAPDPVADDALVAAIAAAMAAPPLDLRQGPFARRMRMQLDWRLVRRLAVLAVALAGLTLAIDVARLVRLDTAASAEEAEADRAAAAALPRGETVTDPARQLDERLRRARGPGRGFSATAAAVYAAVARVPGSEVTAMTFAPDGSLLVGLATQSEGAPTDLKRGIEATGLRVAAGTFASANGRVTGQFTVTPAGGGR